MLTPPSSGIPRSLSGGQNDPRKANISAQSGYHAREMDEKARKDKEDKQRKLVLQKRDLELKEMDLKTQEDKHSALRREITRLENQSQKSTTVTSGTVLNIKTYEASNEAKIEANEKKINTYEQEISNLKRDDEALKQDLEMKKQGVEKAKKDFSVVRGQADTHQRLLQEKTQEAVLAVNRINNLKQEIEMIQGRIQALQR